MPNDLQDWLDDHLNPNATWFVKRLSGNDTLATGAHQAGPYIPRDLLLGMFPQLNRQQVLNPDVRFDLHVDSHTDTRRVRAVWYNNRHHGGTRNEARITNWGGADSALLDPESTGALCVFAFALDDRGAATDCHAWVCRHETEEDVVEDHVGPVEPGKGLIWSPTAALTAGVLGGGLRANCWLGPDDIPPEWMQQFPSPRQVIAKAMELRPGHGHDVDRRLTMRRDCEYLVFRSVEEALVLPRLRQGFATMDQFTTLAQTVLQRRRVRAGLSLELHTRALFVEEGLAENRDFAYNPQSEPGRRPDFLFPSVDAYRRGDFPQNRLRMLAVKTTCKDRWRQILTEAARIPHKHLLTLQEGVSEAQFREMTDANVQLVVPRPLTSKFPNAVQPHLQTLESFIADIRLLAVGPL